MNSRWARRKAIFGKTSINPIFSCYTAVSPWLHRIQIRRKILIILLLSGIVAIPTGGGGKQSRIVFAMRMTPAVFLFLFLLPTTLYPTTTTSSCTGMDADGASHSQQFENFLSEAY